MCLIPIHILKIREYKRKDLGGYFLHVDTFTFLYVISAYIWIYILPLQQKNMIQITYHDPIKSDYTKITLSG